MISYAVRAETLSIRLILQRFPSHWRRTEAQNSGDLCVWLKVTQLSPAVRVRFLNYTTTLSLSKAARKMLDGGEVWGLGVTVHRPCCFGSTGRKYRMLKEKDLVHLSVWSQECGYIEAQGSGLEKMARFLAGSQPKASG